MEYFDFIHIIRGITGAFLILGLLVVIHELGHLLAAKFFGVGVSEFSIGFGKALYRRRFGQTFYALRRIPLGGYVRVLGFGVENLFTRGAGKSAATSPHLEFEKELLEKDPTLSFSKKGYLAKASIVLAGPAANLLFALFVSIGLSYYFGICKEEIGPYVGTVMDDFPADEAGIEPVDKIISLNGREVKTFQDYINLASKLDGSPVSIVVERPMERFIKA